ncbi:hypothetical protein [Halorussus ruber]|uniref:hypothetical protein n=1 Tax=Halorussus ruber TaxID=1126238 RepID=UPI00143DE3C1|nr:hypothetical protein [Halorussus ruber]
MARHRRWKYLAVGLALAGLAALAVRQRRQNRETVEEEREPADRPRVAPAELPAPDSTP